MFFYFWLCWVSIAVPRLLMAGASLVAEDGLQGAWASVLARGLSSRGSQA